MSLLALGARRAGAQERIVVGPNVMVSATSPGQEHAEYFADAHPTDASRVMVCSMRFSQAKNQLTTVIYTTFNGGRTWSLSLEDSASRFNGVWDPACAYGLNGQAFFATLIRPDTVKTDSTPYDVYQWWRMGGDNRLHLYRSRDEGRTWPDTVMLPFLDMATVTVDRTTSPYRGRLYMYGNTAGPGFWLIYSADSGRTWVRSERTDISAHFPRAGTVLPTGTLVLPYTTSIVPPRAIAVSTSTDGGVHLSEPRTVAHLMGQCTEHGMLNMASDHSAGPFRGRAYVVWADLNRGRCSLYLSYSDNEGTTWSAPVRVGDEGPRPRPDERATPTAGTRRATERLMPQVAVSRNGIVGVTWYASAEDTTSRTTRLRFTASLDGGESWLPSVPVSTHGFVIKHPPEFAAYTQSEGGGERRSGRHTDAVQVIVLPSPRSYYPWNGAPGDYTGIAVGTDGVFHAFWIDNRSGVGELYTARVTVEGAVAKPDADLAPLVNITSAVEVQFTSSRWDARTRTLSWGYQLMNTSHDTLVAPLKVRIAKLASDLGTPTLVLDRNRIGQAGTTIDLSHALAGGRLLPGQTTPTQRLQVRVDDVRDTLGSQLSLLVRMQVKVYGNRRLANADSSSNRGSRSERQK